MSPAPFRICDVCWSPVFKLDKAECHLDTASTLFSNRVFRWSTTDQSHIRKIFCLSGLSIAVLVDHARNLGPKSVSRRMRPVADSCIVKFGRLHGSRALEPIIVSPSRKCRRKYHCSEFNSPPQFSASATDSWQIVVLEEAHWIRLMPSHPQGRSRARSSHCLTLSRTAKMCIGKVVVIKTQWHYT